MTVIRLAFIATALLSASPAAAQHWARSWEVGVQAAPRSLARAHPKFQNQTLRQIVRVSIGGQRLRLRLSNEMTSSPTRIGTVRVALVDEKGAIVPGSDRAVRFSNSSGVTIGANAAALSDPVGLEVKPMTRVAVSIFFPAEIAAPTYHDFADATHWFAPGDQTKAAALRQPALFISNAILAGIDVESAQPRRTVVAFGDSITDGAMATLNLDRRWPDLLAQRFQNSKLDVGVANAGIGGNQLLRDGGAPSGLTRFERDALDVPGVSHVIVLEGVNDLGIAAYAKIPLPTPEAMIDGFRQMIAKARKRGVKVVLGTIMPFKGARYWTPEGEANRKAVNAWIRDNKEADGYIDFAAAVTDSNDSETLAKALDSGDKLHPNDQGMLALANAIPLKLLR